MWAYMSPPRMRSIAVGGGYWTLSLAWDGAVMMPLHGTKIGTKPRNRIGWWKNRNWKWTVTIAQYKNWNLKPRNRIIRWQNRNFKMNRQNRLIQKSELDIDWYNRKIESVSEDRSIGPFAHHWLAGYSLRAYSYLCNSMKNCLPSIGTLRKYRNRVDGSPDFYLAALHMVKSFEIKSDWDGEKSKKQIKI